MCGIFGGIADKSFLNENDLIILAKHSEQRGRDSSGLIYVEDGDYNVKRVDFSITSLMKTLKLQNRRFLLGHSRLITNGLSDNQPVVKGDLAILHNGIIVNDSGIWPNLKTKRSLEIDTEVIAAIAEEFLSTSDDLDGLSSRIFELCEGVVSCALILKSKGKLLLFSNNGSLYFGTKNDAFFFASERYGLDIIGCNNVDQILNSCVLFEIPKSESTYKILDFKSRTENLIPSLIHNIEKERLLEFNEPNFRRCTKCILPETMPFIVFDADGVCNYCKNYSPRNRPKPKKELFELIDIYRRPNKELDCIVPFSGGRDSCFGLHLIVNELKMKPVTYTYDWGMVTDLGRRNISRMCSKLGVENIIVAADITQKRKNIRRNLIAWLKSPNLGMMSILTAGDKHFFRYVEDVKKQTGIKLNLWGVNPLEVTHFKTGFLGIAPDFNEKKVYSHGILKQLSYHFKRFSTMMESPGYFNASLFDTLSGEYYRSITNKEDYFHIFDYWCWDENEVNDCLLNDYDWEKASDTPTTWRIGDGTAAFYNYVYFTVAGFSEHDTFRSNQIREGQISREEALAFVKEENRPRYENLKWYLDTLSLDFEDVVKVVNNIPKLY